jgi:hypothetical protein
MSSWSRNAIVRSSPVLKKPRKENTVSITVCINFADKLSHTLEFNTQFLKKLYVVTDPEDKDTIKLCSTYKNVEVLFCKDVHKNGAKFNKSGLVKYAQVIITPNHREDWVMIIDADTILPPNFWSESIHLHPQFTENTVYLMKRKIYQSIEDLKNDKVLEIQTGCGFFQLYYSKNKMYADFSESAADCDILFQELFRNQKTLNGFCIHLGQNGLDWNGRLSQSWTLKN